MSDERVYTKSTTSLRSRIYWFELQERSPRNVLRPFSHQEQRNVARSLSRQFIATSQTAGSPPGCRVLQMLMHIGELHLTPIYHMLVRYQSIDSTRCVKCFILGILHPMGTDTCSRDSASILVLSRSPQWKRQELVRNLWLKN